MTDPIDTPIFMQRNTFDPVTALTDLLNTEGVIRVTIPFLAGREGYLVTRYEDVKAVLANSATFGSLPMDFGHVSDEEQQQLRAGNLVDFDPPEHTRLRKMLTPEFTVRRMRRLEPRIVAIVEGFLDDLEAHGPPADLVERFALPVPSLVICELLGVPYADRDEFQDRARRSVDDTLTTEEQLALAREDRAYMADLVARAQADPGDDLLGMLVREHGHELSADELTGIGTLLLFAGHETTANMLGLGTLALLRHPDQLAIMRDEPDAVDSAVEELLRWLSVVPMPNFRIAKSDIEVRGHTITAGEAVVVSLPAANRDPRFIDEPDRLDLRRGAPGHVAFGHGVHHCIGAPLARMEMRIAFPALLRRLPHLAPAIPFQDIQFRANHAVYGVHALPVTW